MAEDSGAILRHISSLKDMLDKVQNPRTSSDPYSSLLSLLLLGLELSDWGQCRHRAASIGISWSPHGWMAYPGVLQASPTASYNHIRVSISDRRELHRNWLVEACGSYSMSQLVFIWELRVHTFAWVQLSWFADMFSIVVSKFFTALGTLGGCYMLLCHLSCTNFQYSDAATTSSFLLKIWLVSCHRLRFCIRGHDLEGHINMLVIYKNVFLNEKYIAPPSSFYLLTN